LTAHLGCALVLAMPSSPAATRPSGTLLPILASLLFLALIAFTVHRTTDTISDLDNFYHMRHAWLYRTTGLMRTDFPWVEFSVIKQHASDLWYGFHLLLVPLTMCASLLDAIEWGSILCTACALWLFYAACRAMELRRPLVWTVLFLVISAQVTYRLTMLRPHCLSLGLDVLLFAVLSSCRRGWRVALLVFAIAALHAFVHLTLSWLPLLIAVVVSTVQLALRQRKSLTNAAAIVLGLAVGILARPHPMGSLALVYTQLVRWYVEKRSQPLMIGTELRPITWVKFADQFLPLSILALLALAWLVMSVRRSPTETAARYRVIAWSALALMLVFLVACVRVALRSADYYVAFGIVFLASVTSHYQLGGESGFGRRLSYWPRVALSFVVAGVLFWSLSNNVYRYQRTLRRAYASLAEKDVAEWLQANTPPGSVVFHVEWEKFAPLFFWNQHNHYINGMDPIFEYEYDPSLYWKHHHMMLDHVASDRGRTLVSTSSEAPPDDVYSVLTRDFRAVAVVVDPMVNPRLIECLRADRRFKQAFEGAHELVFQVLSTGARP
jgi:hypothetical protein